MSHELTKLPFEKFPLLFSFAHELVDDELMILPSPEVTCVNIKTGADTKGQIIDSNVLSGARDVKVVVKAGVLGEIHKITVKINTNLDNFLEKEVFVSIRKAIKVPAFFKQPSEEFSIANEFTDDVELGDTVSTLVVAATKLDDGSNQTSVVIKGSGIDVHCAHMHLGVMAGRAGEYFELSFQIVTALGFKYEKLVNMVLVEV